MLFLNDTITKKTWLIAFATLFHFLRDLCKQMSYPEFDFPSVNQTRQNPCLTTFVTNQDATPNMFCSKVGQ